MRFTAEGENALMDTAEVHSCIRENKTEFTSEKTKPESPVPNKSASDKSDNTAPDKFSGSVPDKTDPLPEAQHVRNSNSQTIFKNARLTCEFLRDYSGISLFSDIQPEDIEDMTDRYQALLGIDFESDTVKKVHVHSKEEEIVYVISLML